MVRKATASEGFQTRAQVSGLISSQAPTVVDGLLPIPTYRFSVPSNVVALGNAPMVGILIDRNATLSTFAFALTGLTVVGAILGIKIQKNGVDIPGTAISVTSATLSQSLSIPNSVTVSPGDSITVVRTSLTALSTPGMLYGYIRAN